MIAWQSSARNRLPLSRSSLTQFTLNDKQVSARTGETVLTALRMNLDHGYSSALQDMPRAGFCLMGACQDCWLWRTDGAPIRACTTLVEQGMQLKTKSGMAR